MGEVTSLEFRDIDHFREQLCGWDTPAIQIEPGLLNIRLDRVDLGGLIFIDVRVSRKVMDHSRPRPGWFKCVVNLAPAVFCGVEVNAGHLTVLTPGREYRSILTSGWRSIEIIVSSSALADEGLCLPPQLAADPENAMIDLPVELVGIFRGLADVAFRRDVAVRMKPASLRRALLRALDKAFSIGVYGRRGDGRARAADGYDLARRMIRCIESRFGQHLTVNELAGELDVTPRALHYAARAAIGVSPHDLIQAFRLNQVRSELWTARMSEPNITTAALTQDFTHLGRFSQQYRTLFGELPSQTVQRVRQLA